MNIYYSNPFSIEKNFGKAINDFCELVPNDEDWIVIQDGDMMYLQPDFGTVIYNIIQANKDKFAIMGCKTNRSGVLAQCEVLSEDHNILNHIEKSKTYSGTLVKECEVVAGFFMCFSKETWKKVGKFKENTHAFDSNFSLRARGLGLKIGIMQGLYVYHQYRPLSKNPRSDVKHLK